MQNFKNMSFPYTLKDVKNILRDTPKLNPTLVEIADGNAPNQVIKPDLKDAQKHWLLVGICLHSVLSPALRQYIVPTMTAIYTTLQSKEKIDTQTYPKHLKQYQPTKVVLNYEAINNNETLKGNKSQHDYKVKTAVELSKLFLTTRMAQYTAFDNTCDLSALLLILEKIDNKNTSINSIAEQVRTNIRNPWAHYNVAEWDIIQYQKAFQLSEQLIRNLPLPTNDQVYALAELTKWKNNGIHLLKGTTLGFELLQIIRNETKSLAQYTLHLTSSMDITIEAAHVEIREINEKIDTVFNNLRQIGCDQTLMKQRIKTTSEDVAVFKEKTDHLDNVTKEIQLNVVDLKIHIESTSDKVNKLEKDLEQTKIDVSGNIESIKDIQKYMSNKRPDKVFFYPPDKMLFVGREYELEKLESDLLNNSEMQCIRFICGLGGVGKTTLVVEYAWQMQEHYPGGVFWMSAESNDTLEESIYKLAFDINTNGQNAKETFHKTLSWLKSLQERWLLVVDNLDCDYITGNIQEVVLGAWRRNSKGHIIVTTRREALQASEAFHVKKEYCLMLDILTDRESLQFLSLRTGIALNETDQDLLSLVENLGGLPLALEQAAAHITVLHCSFKEYLDGFLQKRLKLLKTAHSKSFFNISKERLAVTTTWKLNFEYIQKQSEEEGIGRAAVTVMEVTAFLAADEIPTELINIGSPEVCDNDLLNALQNELGAKQVTEVLTRFSLFKRPSINSISVHRIVQEVIRDNISDRNHLKCVLQCATRMVNKMLETTTSPIDVLKDGETRRGSLHQWNKLVLNANVLSANLLKFSRKEVDFKEIVFNIETAKLLQATAIYQSLVQRQDQALAAQSQMLEIVTALEMTDDTFRDLTSIKIPLLDKERSIIQGSIVAVLSENMTSEQPPLESERLRLLGNEAFKNKRFLDAIQYYSEGIRADLEHIDPRLLCNRSLVYLKSEQYENALDDADHCIKLDSTMWKSYCWKAYAIASLVRTGVLSESYKSAGQASAAAAVFINEQCLWEDRMQIEYPLVLYRLVTNPSEFGRELSSLYNRTFITFLLKNGRYVIHNPSLMSKSVQVIGIEDGVEIECQCVIFLTKLVSDMSKCTVNIYFENVNFVSGSGQIVVDFDVTATFFRCKFSNGFKGCDDFPLCKGGKGCTNTDKNGCKSLRDTLQQHLHKPSGVVGGAGVVANNGGHVVLNKCILDRCGGGGTLCEKPGSVLEIRNSEVKNMRQSGIESRYGGKTIAEKNLVHQNQFHGVAIGPSGIGIIRENSIQGNGREGIWCGGILATEGHPLNEIVNVSGGSQCQIISNLIFNNGLNGISMDGGWYEVDGNKIFKNWSWGAFVKSRSSLHLTNNDIFENKCGGVRIGINFSATIVLDGNTIRDHTGPGLHAYEMGSTVTIMKDEVAEFSNSPILTSRNIIIRNDTGFQHPSKMHEAIQACGNCHSMSATLKQCSRCMKASYCSKQCQENHWNRHKHICKMLCKNYTIEINMQDTENVNQNEHIPLKGIRRKVIIDQLSLYPLPGIGEGEPVNRQKTQRFIVKIQTGPENTPYDPYTRMLLYNQHVDVYMKVKNPNLYHLAHECGVLTAAKCTTKTIFCWASFKAGGSILCIHIDNLPPFQTW